MLIYVRKRSFDVCSVSLSPVSFRRLKFPFRVIIERAHSIRAYRSSSRIFIAFDRPLFARRVLPAGSIALISPLVPHLRTEVGWSPLRGRTPEDRKGILDCFLDLSSFPFKPLPFSVALTFRPQKSL